MSTREIVLFVYDDLMNGEAQHERVAAARPLGTAVTAPKYDLVDLGTSGGALVPGGLVAVSGELYAFEPAALAALDVHKGHPLLYQRSPILLADGREVDAYCIAPQQAVGRRRVRSGDWRQRPGAPGAGRSRETGPLVSWAKRRFDR